MAQRRPGMVIQRVSQRVALGFALVLGACGTPEPAHSTDTSIVDSSFRFGEAEAKNERGEVLTLHADGSFEYRPADGVLRGRLHAGEILDENGTIIARYSDDGRIVVTDPLWAVEQRIAADGTYSIREQPLWRFDAAGDTIEVITGDVVLQTSTVPSELRRSMMLAQVAFALIFQDYRMRPADAQAR